MERGFLLSYPLRRSIGNPAHKWLQTFEKVLHRDTQGHGQGLDGVERDVRATGLYPAHVSTYEAALFSKYFLGQAAGFPQFLDPGAEAFAEDGLHPHFVRAAHQSLHTLIVICILKVTLVDAL